MEGIVAHDDLDALAPKGDCHFLHSALVIVNCYLHFFGGDQEVWGIRQQILEAISRLATTQSLLPKMCSSAFVIHARFAVDATRAFVKLRLDERSRSVCSGGTQFPLMLLFWIELLSVVYNDVRIWFRKGAAMITLDLSAFELHTLEHRICLDGQDWPEGTGEVTGEPKAMLCRASLCSTTSEKQPFLLQKENSILWWLLA